MRARRRIVPGLAAIAAGLALPGAALAALGDADPTFGVRGSVPLALPTSGIVAPTAPTVTAFRRLADGTLQVVGSLGDGRRVVLARLRYGADGVRRPGREGTAPVPIGNGAFAVSASVPAGDGGELVLGTTHTGRGVTPAVARLTANGALAPAFGRGGLAELPRLDGLVEPVAIGVDARGRALVLARRSADDGTTSAVLVRLTPTGALDRTYDRDGVVAIPVGRGSEVGFGILAVAGDGAATIVGRVEPSTPGGSGITYLRLTPAGAPDARFGTRGRVEPTVPGAVAFSPSGIALEPAGGIAVLGTAFISPTERSAAAMRLRADGSLDPAFGGAVPLRLLPALGSTSSGGGQLVRSADGGLTGTGVASYELAPTSRLLVVRLAGDGTPVATFGTGGVTVIGTVVPVGPRGVDAVPGGGAVVAGFSASGLALLRIGATGLLESDARDTAGGTFQRGLLSPLLRLVPGGGIVASSWLERNARIARLDALGRPVRSFGLPLLPGGVVVDAPPDARVEEITPRADGTLLVVGRTDTVGFVQRRRANGSSDPSWGGGDGRVELPTGTAVARALLLADGSVLLGGSRFVGVERVMMIARLTPGGALDPLFGGGDGIADVPYPTGAFSAGLPPGVRALTLAPDGSIVFVDTAERLTGGFLTVIGRLTASGAPDASFGAGGLRTAPLASASVYSAVRDAAGRLVVGGMAGDDGLVLRLRSDGSADPTFGTNGVTIIPAASGAVRVTGIGSYPDGSSVLHLLVLPNGSGLGLFRLVQLDRRGRNVAQRPTLLDAVADPVVLPDGRLLIGDDHRVSTGSEGRIARVLGPPPPRPLSVRRAGRVARGFVLSARVDARGLTGVSLQVEVRRNGRFVRVGRRALAPTVGLVRVAVRARGLRVGRRYTARLVLVSASGRTATTTLTARTRG